MNLKKMVLNILQRNFLFAGLVLLTMLLSGCIDQEEARFVEHHEVGRCADEPGTLIRLLPADDWTRFQTYLLNTVLWFAYNPRYDHFCIPDLPKDKISNLTAEEKQQLRIDFVNRGRIKTTKDKVLNKIGPPKHSSFLDLQNLVRKGSELAYLEMNLDSGYDSSWIVFKEDNPHYQRLKYLAYEQQDAEAMCLYSNLTPTPFKGYEYLNHRALKKAISSPNTQAFHERRWLEGPEDKWGRGMKKAADMGSMKCMTSHAYWSYRNMILEPYSESDRKKIYLSLAPKGEWFSIRTIASSYRLGSGGFKKDLAKSKCWMQRYNQFDVSKPFTQDQINQIEPLAVNRTKPGFMDQYRAYRKAGIKIHPDLKDLPVYDPDNNCELLEGAAHE